MKRRRGRRRSTITMMMRGSRRRLTHSGRSNRKKRKKLSPPIVSLLSPLWSKSLIFPFFFSKFWTAPAAKSPNNARLWISQPHKGSFARRRGKVSEWSRQEVLTENVLMKLEMDVDVDGDVEVDIDYIYAIEAKGMPSKSSFLPSTTTKPTKTKVMDQVKEGEEQDCKKAVWKLSEKWLWYQSCFRYFEHSPLFTSSN